MTVDPADPETFANDDEPEELDPEAPEADAAEQRKGLEPQEDDGPLTVGDPASADEGDLAEQARVVELDEDDYR
ncbi:MULTISPECIES: hypothetical protein [unclassified Streptomyces]|uniref:hypothetical protein n=1 Tax=unclassified Streptomyces TaxID=2593676 RepID=UPI00224ED29A|nr:MULTISPECIES: hypothetical protein [unclassified Streptomyces]MCX4971589.1 hypothetical protein [Streptomyces sp. NBC_00620]WTB38514.1 hypothetical protein OG569_11245 [Streptomyces sp. NBC_00827]WUC13883.1 hypothetical protein OG256_30245 [Streptomyces sp. NBC_00564]WUC49610.1 hypothetical protein OG266_14790 [Streptomyces sp. NBC_00554]